MAELRTLQSRIKTLNTRRVNILKGSSVVSVAVHVFPQASYLAEGRRAVLYLWSCG